MDPITMGYIYSLGWEAISTSQLCDRMACRCRGSGACCYPVFNHYMVRDSSSPDLQVGHEAREVGNKLSTFPICVERRTVDEISVEEVPCVETSMFTSLDYYSSCVMEDVSTQTLVSVATVNSKSVCFDMECAIIRVRNDCKSIEGICILETQDGYMWLLAGFCTILDSIMEAMCFIGIDPVTHRGNHVTVYTKGKGGKKARLNLDTKVFKVSEDIGLFVNGDIRSCNHYVLAENSGDVTAVRTALVTVSIVLTPKSLYGGINPTTKTVLYHVHNVKF